jgi:hypothetical protein
VTFGKVLTRLIEADTEIGTDLGEIIRESFRARGIVPEHGHRPHVG